MEENRKCMGYCKLELPIENFAKNKSKGGYQTECRDCKRQYDKEYREKNKEKIKARKQKYANDNKDKIKEKRQKYYQENKEKLSNQNKQTRNKIKNTKKIVPETKICYTCEKEKNKKDFYLNEYILDGLTSSCKKCIIEQEKERKKEIIKTKEYKQKRKVYRDKNKEDLKIKKQKYYEENKEKIAENKKEWRIRNKDKIAEQKREYYQENKEKITEHNKEYYNKNKDKRNKKQRDRFNNDIEYKISVLLRTRLTKALHGNYKTGSAVRDLGCSICELKIHLESQFYVHTTTGEIMSWDNYGSGWHIDHIQPLASFDLTDREQLLKACNYTNLQPLWAEENLKKGDRIINVSPKEK